ARDYVKLMWLMLKQDKPGDYVGQTGRTANVREFSDLAFAHVGLRAQEHIVIDQRFLRPAEVDMLLGNPAKARQKLGWVAETSLEQLVAEMVAAGLARLTNREHL